MKINSLITFLIVCFLAVLPPIDFFILNPPNPYWLWMIMIAGFLGIFICFMETDLMVKCIAVIGFLNCFGSAVPYVSFTSYISLVACCYLYIFSSRITDWSLIFKGLQATVILNLILFSFQYLNHDSLMNFGLFHVEQFGVIGQHMQEGSWGIVVSALLLTFSKFNFIAAFLISLMSQSVWSFVAAGVGMVTYIYSFHKYFAGLLMISLLLIGVCWGIHSGKFTENMDSKSGRVAVYERTFQLAWEHPWRGWGIGTYKIVFPALSKLKCIPYKTAHNFIAQIVFECGYLFTGCLLFAMGCLLVRLWRDDQWLLLSGSLMIITDGLAHFPDRMIQTVPMIVIFLAYIRFIKVRYSNG